MSEDRALEARLELLEKKYDELRRYVDKERAEAQSEAVKAKLALGQAQRVLQELLDLFALRPDSSISTTRRTAADGATPIECWEAPAEDLRPVLEQAEKMLHQAQQKETCPHCGRTWYVTPGAELAYCGHCREFLRPVSTPIGDVNAQDTEG